MTGSPTGTGRVALAVCGILLVAAGLRLYVLSAAPLQESELPAWSAVIAYLHTDEAPQETALSSHRLFQALLPRAGKLLGDHVTLLRGLSLLTGLLTCVLLGLTVRRLAGATAGLWAMALCAVWPTHVLWSALLTPMAFTGCLAMAALYTMGRRNPIIFVLHLAIVAGLLVDSRAAFVWLVVLAVLGLRVYPRGLRLVWATACLLVAVCVSLLIGFTPWEDVTTHQYWPYLLLGVLTAGTVVASRSSAAPVRALAAVALAAGLGFDAVRTYAAPPVTPWETVANHFADFDEPGTVLTLRPELGELIQAAHAWPVQIYQTVPLPEELVLASEDQPARAYGWILEYNEDARLLLGYLTLRGIEPEVLLAHGAPTVLAVRVNVPPDFVASALPGGAAHLRKAALAVGNSRLRFLAARILHAADKEAAAYAVAESIGADAFSDERSRVALADLLRTLGDEAGADTTLGLNTLDDPVNSAIQEAHQLRSVGKRGEAIRVLRDAAGQHNTNGLLPRMLGDFLLEAGQKEAAKTVYAAIAESSPHHAYAQTQTAALLLAEAKPEEAIPLLQEAIASSAPEGIHAPILLAEALIAAGRAREIQQLQQDLLQAGWPRCTTQIVMALGAEALGDTTFAISLYSDLITQYPQCVESYGRADDLLQRATTRRNRIAFWQKLSEALPENDRVHFHRGLALGNVGMLDEAAEAFRRALAIAPEDPGYLTELAAIRLKQGDIQNTLTLTEQAIAVLPVFKRAHLLRIEALETLGDAESLQEAREAAARAGVNPDSPS